MVDKAWLVGKARGRSRGNATGAERKVVNMIAERARQLRAARSEAQACKYCGAVIIWEKGPDNRVEMRNIDQTPHNHAPLEAPSRVGIYLNVYGHK